ncbi:hypothetical protein BHF71_02800 [Vulcanibacillus modesticaldus]|uniref:Glycosyl transferase family 1 n=1 Tax=Vulcanibacillus modesticaldus TaxID=337097 RepID=A0A1D2YT58_9BACI|nr:glycosyltransferase [Vulcanibacillus modesticaldus]OEF98873.1 hypothetical protein BHF71_02800 [Vulcanibacillus modesticaldus]
MAVIIYPPTLDWNWMFQRPQQLMKQFALDGHEVYFCNKTQSSKLFSQALPNLFVVHNNKRFIQEIIPKFKKQRKKIILWFSWPLQSLYVHRYSPDFVIFDFIDNFPEWSKYVKNSVQKADIVITSAKNLQNYIEKNFPKKKSYLISNGCDIKHFQRYKDSPPEKPREYLQHNGPIIGYVGAWAPWVDTNLIKQVAQAFPNALITIIGTEFGRKFNTSSKNIVFLGHKPYQQIPRYLYYCDVCLIPFKINQITSATNPIKMYEYLAAGKPVVSTNIPEARNVPNVFVGKDNNSFIKNISLILNNKIPIDYNRSNNWIKLHSWQMRYYQIKRILSSHRKNLI